MHSIKSKVTQQVKRSLSSKIYPILIWDEKTQPADPYSLAGCAFLIFLKMEFMLLKPKK